MLSLIRLTVCVHCGLKQASSAEQYAHSRDANAETLGRLMEQEKRESKREQAKDLLSFCVSRVKRYKTIERRVKRYTDPASSACRGLRDQRFECLRRNENGLYVPVSTVKYFIFK